MKSADGKPFLPDNPIRNYLRLTNDKQAKIGRISLFPMLGDVILFLAFTGLFTLDSMDPKDISGTIGVLSPDHRPTNCGVAGFMIGSKLFFLATSVYIFRQISADGSYPSLKRSRLVSHTNSMRILALLFDLVMLTNGTVDLGPPKFFFYTITIGVVIVDVVYSYFSYRWVKYLIEDLKVAIYFCETFDEKKHLKKPEPKPEEKLVKEEYLPECTCNQYNECENLRVIPKPTPFVPY